MIGYFSVDLLLEHSEVAEEDQRFYLIGLDCYLNRMAGSVACVNFLTNSKYNLESNLIQRNSARFANGLHVKERLN